MPKVSHYKNFLLFEICALFISEMSVNKHTETIEYVQKQAAC